VLVISTIPCFEGDLKEKGLKHAVTFPTSFGQCFEGDLKEKGLKLGYDVY